jgi:hypothetical protein
MAGEMAGFSAASATKTDKANSDKACKQTPNENKDPFTFAVSPFKLFDHAIKEALTDELKVNFITTNLV